MTWQDTNFSTPAHDRFYNARNGVERWFSRVKTDNGIDFTDRLRVRGLAKVTFMTALAAVATNLLRRYRKAYSEGWRAPDD